MKFENSDMAVSGQSKSAVLNQTDNNPTHKGAVVSDKPAMTNPSIRLVSASVIDACRSYVDMSEPPELKPKALKRGPVCLVKAKCAGLPWKRQLDLANKVLSAQKEAFLDGKAWSREVASKYLALNGVNISLLPAAEKDFINFQIGYRPRFAISTKTMWIAGEPKTINHPNGCFL